MLALQTNLVIVKYACTFHNQWLTKRRMKLSAGFGVRSAAEGGWRKTAEEKPGQRYLHQCAVHRPEEKAYGNSPAIHLSGEHSI